MASPDIKEMVAVLSTPKVAGEAFGSGRQ